VRIGWIELKTEDMQVFSKSLLCTTLRFLGYTIARDISSARIEIVHLIHVW
jgi:hypothetical protein